MKLLPHNHQMYIEPSDPITTPREFTDELVKHFSQQGKSITVQEESMEPVIEVDGVIYVCKLGEPYRAFNPLKVPIRSGSLSYLGYQWIYLYRCDP
ncbi:hypothetical protein H9X86_04575 [Pseudoflavonifractor capillosus]|uniref:hypothetical protein n=1 Tax=Pseudoflavonifractor capillosus TaxID=106588 RepID=UPI0019570310|nr:hypothetical protein [Pseudoflavonifractor capillosus]MBM6896648.1 hypothetical protein [Pseudoflavonifractor capillosus]